MNTYAESRRYTLRFPRRNAGDLRSLETLSFRLGRPSYDSYNDHASYLQ